MAEASQSPEQLIATAETNIREFVAQVQPERPPVQIRFTDRVRGVARFTYADDTVHLPSELVEPAAMNPQLPPLRGLILHELGHRDDGPHFLFKRSPLSVLAAIPVMVISGLFLYYAQYQTLWVTVAAAVALLCVAGQVRSWHETEYHCDDYARLHSDADTILATLTMLVAVHEAILASKPLWRRPWIIAYGALTHPTLPRRIERQHHLRTD